MANTEQQHEVFGPYELVSDRRNSTECWGALWHRATNKEVTNKVIVEVVQGATTDDCMEKLRAVVYRLREAELPPDDGDLPPLAVVVDSLRHALKHATPNQKVMLAAHLNAPDRCITATELAAAANFKEFRAANLQYGKLGALIFWELPSRLPRRKSDDQPIWTCAIAFEEDATAGGDYEDAQFRWRMRPHIAEALRAAKIF